VAGLLGLGTGLAVWRRSRPASGATAPGKAVPGKAAPGKAAKDADREASNW
jgi:hypothetical protein